MGDSHYVAGEPEAVVGRLNIEDDMKLIDIRAFLSDPDQRRELMVRAIMALQAREGINTTRAQAERAYGRAEHWRAQGAVNAPRKLSRFDSCPSHQWREVDGDSFETPARSSGPQPRRSSMPKNWKNDIPLLLFLIGVVVAIVYSNSP